MRYRFLFFLLLASLAQVRAQSDANKLKFDFYGFVRVDYYYDSRQSVTANENLLFLYPKDKNPDANGEDLNALSNAGFFGFNTRPGVKVSGLDVFGAKASAVAEADFAGYSNNSTLLRIRLAYINFDWGKYNLLLGQQWHPFFNPVSPAQLSLSTGAPFQPFNRSPQIRFDYKMDKFTLSGAALYQFQFQSQGPGGKSAKYQTQALVPELVLTLDYKNKGFQAGLGFDYATLKPRTQFTLTETIPGGGQVDNTYKVDEHFSSLSYTAYLKYQYELFSASLKSSLLENPTHLTMLGGYGVKSEDEKGKREYTPFRNSSTWLDLSYGKKHMANLFLGYSKNLGSKDTLLTGSTIYGDGMNVQELYRISPSYSYNIPHFRIGLEYEFSLAKYGRGTFDWNDGLYSKTEGVNNHRIVATASYIF